MFLRILIFLLSALTILIVFFTYQSDKASDMPHDAVFRRCGITLLGCVAISMITITELLGHFPQFLEKPPAYVSSAPTVSEPEPTVSQIVELSITDYAEILHNSEGFDGKEVRVAGRISRLSDHPNDALFLRFRDRLGGEFDREFDIHLGSQLSSGEFASHYYQEGQYVIVEGKWEDWRKRLHGTVVSTGEEARQAAQVFEDAWEAEMRGYADTTPIIDYMDFVALPEKYAGQRVRTIGQVFSVQTNTTWEGEEYTLLFIQNRDPVGESIIFSLKGCPLDMQSSVSNGDYILLSGIVSRNETELNDCFIESIGDTLQPLSEQFENEWQKRRSAELEAYFASCQEYTYDDLVRYPKSYDGKRIRLSGTVIQTRLDQVDGCILLDVGQGNMVYVSYHNKLPNEPEILEGDQITFFGECAGNTFYYTAQNVTQTVPWVIAQYSSFNQLNIQ